MHFGRLRELAIALDEAQDALGAAGDRFSCRLCASPSVAVAASRAAATISAPDRASDVTGVSEFMISWVSTRTRSACAATSSAPSSLCTGRIDRTVTGRSSRATCADAKIAFCGTPSSISRVILRVPGGQSDRRGKFGPERLEVATPVAADGARTAGAPPC